MRHRTLAAVALAVTVVLAGCSGLDQTVAGDSTTPTPQSEPTTTATATATDASTAAVTDTRTETTTQTETSSPTPTPTATPYEWTEPNPPNGPVEDKTDAESWDRITSVEVVDTVAAENGSGYSNFDLAVRANTSMSNVDPASHGTVEGEPYFLVYVNGDLVERTKELLQEDDRTFTVEMRPGGLAQFESGELNLTVKLVDRDSEYDDVYGVWNGTVQYTKP